MPWVGVKLAADRFRLRRESLVRPFQGTDRNVQSAYGAERPEPEAGD